MRVKCSFTVTKWFPIIPEQIWFLVIPEEQHDLTRFSNHRIWVIMLTNSKLISLCENACN